jgi:hypothetical protein
LATRWLYALLDSQRAAVSHLKVWLTGYGARHRLGYAVAFASTLPTAREHIADGSFHRFPKTGQEQVEWRCPSIAPTTANRLMQKVSRYVAAHIGDLPSRNQVEEQIKGRREFVRQAIDVLVAEGFLEEEDGPRNARLLRSIRPFREGDDAEA